MSFSVPSYQLIAALLSQGEPGSGFSVWERLTDPRMLPVVLVFGVGALSVVGGFWYAIVRERSRNELKRDMLSRGMSVEEIERVLAAGDSRHPHGKRRRHD